LGRKKEGKRIKKDREVKRGRTSVMEEEDGRTMREANKG
jgi:hypothetical protein